MTTALERSRDASWQVRRAAAAQLGSALPDAVAFTRLVAMVDDPDDTAVGQQAAIELAVRGGTPGLAAVAKAYATLDDDMGYVISGALGTLSTRDGFPLRAGLDALAADVDPDVVRGAAELREYLHVE